MFSWLTSLFNTKNTEIAVETGSHLLKEAANGIDKLFYTEEERADAKERAFQRWLEFQKLPESPIRGVTRRLIAVPWMWLQMIMMVAAMAGYFFNQGFSILCVDMMREGNTVTWTIVIFYFGPYMVEQVIARFKGKKQ